MIFVPDTIQLAKLYSHTWRTYSQLADVPLERIVVRLESILRDGGVGLVWPSIRHRAEDYGAVGEMLEHTYQQYLAALEQIEKDIALVVSMLVDAGIEAVLVKGWALCRLYELPQVRRPGDIDLIVPTGTMPAAQKIIAEAYNHDFRNGVDLYDDSTWKSKPSSDYRERLVYRECNGVPVATLGSTDALRHVCLHFMKHLGNRVPNTTPYWLCDIGALVENSEDIDWDRLFSGDPALADRIRLALVLSRDIVGTDPSRLPAAIAEIRLPDWAIQSVTDLWMNPHQQLGRSAAQAGVPRALVKRLWPSPLNAALRCDVPLHTGSPLRYQVEVSARLIGLYATRVITLGKLGQ